MLTYALHHVTLPLQSHHDFGGSIVNVALTTIQRELGFAAASLQRAVTGHALTIELLLLVADAQVPADNGRAEGRSTRSA
jgi:hypothetical protein